ncbi:MAG: response regulator, partial [Holdemanella porci]|uniref:hybrid sensor histidine kinase/response regulator n=1 Tax=Holdemanella porci TaxID=2652276 RepID=UPI00242F6169
IVKEREEQNKQLNEALKKERTYNEIIHAIGSIYKSITTIDLKKQTYTVLSYNSSDKKITETDFKGNMNQLKQYFLDKNSTSPFVDEVLEFIDLDTIPERMKGKNILTLEMKGQNGKWHACSIIPQTYDKNHNLTNVLMTLSDIDDIKKRELEAKEKLKEAAIEAKQANLAKTNFLRRISHDIRTPLNGIVGMINLSERYSNDTDKLYECKEKVLTSLDYLLSLINDILDMNKVESGTLVLENKPFNLIDIINKIIAIVETNCEQHNIQFFGGKDMSKIIHRNFVGSGEYLNRLLMNIASNAIKYNREGGSVTLYCTELSSDDTHALYEFVCKDTGLGMSEEFQKHAFEPFTCEGKPTTTGYNGTGLGLSIVKDIVEMMHGTIQMESKENVGTIFRILLPLQIDPNPQIIKPIQTKPLNLTNKKALLVEDNDINLEIATILLQDLGLDVSTARNGQEAIDQFKKSKLYTFDYIFMDIMMPVKDGLEATKEIRALPRSDAKSVHILAMSANAFESDIQECLKAGMDGHIAKPITMELLKEKLAK